MDKRTYLTSKYKYCGPEIMTDYGVLIESGDSVLAEENINVATITAVFKKQKIWPVFNEGKWRELDEPIYIAAKYITNENIDIACPDDNGDKDETCPCSDECGTHSPYSKTTEGVARYKYIGPSMVLRQEKPLNGLVTLVDDDEVVAGAYDGELRIIAVQKGLHDVTVTPVSVASEYLIEKPSIEEHVDDEENSCTEYANTSTGVTASTDFRGIVDELTSLYESKNADYGNSFASLFSELGMKYAYGHLKEKVNRIGHLITHAPEVSGESLEDSLKDIANYAILSIMELRQVNQLAES